MVFDDGTYELKWVDRGDYQLCTDGDPNWQPSFGYFRSASNLDSIIHNSGLPYQEAYKISLDGDTLVREHRRYMSIDAIEHNNLAYWSAGQYLNYREVFVRVTDN